MLHTIIVRISAVVLTIVIDIPLIYFMKFIGTPEFIMGVVTGLFNLASITTLMYVLLNKEK